MEIRRWCYLSFRQASAPFIIIGSIFFLSRKFFFSSIFLALAVYCHPHNGIIFFVVLNIALLISFLSSKDRLADIVAFIKFAFPFLIIISPYMLTALSTFRDVEPIPFLKFWELTIKNEPGDASTLYSLKNMHPPYLLSFYLTLAAVFLHFLFKSDTPKIKFNNTNSNRGGKDMLWTMMLAPWVLVSFGCLWELGMMNYLPDFLNDICYDDQEALQFFAQGQGDRYQFNLPSYGLSLLRGAGLRQVEWTGHCTYADPARFISYRHSAHANAADYGRLIACISL